MIKYFYIPGYYIFYDYFQLFYIYKNEHSNYFHSDRIIAGSYDLPFGLAWNGGRGGPISFANISYNENKIKNIMEYYQNLENFILLHTCTNFYINTKELLNDEKCNNFLSSYYRPQDKVIIASKQLKNYLRIKFPNMNFVNSTTLGITDIDQVNNISKNEIYVLYYGKNNDNNYLKSLKYPENIEILCAETCIPNCPYRSKHYEAISKAQLGDITDAEYYANQCPYLHKEERKNIPKMIETYDFRVNNNRIEELSQMGFTHFKLSGRTHHPAAWLQLLIYYLVKPVYWNTVYHDLINFFIT